jgi:hypothetical protein
MSSKQMLWVDHYLVPFAHLSHSDRVDPAVVQQMRQGEDAGHTRCDLERWSRSHSSLELEHPCRLLVNHISSHEDNLASVGIVEPVVLGI